MGKIPILTNIFQMGWNHQPDYKDLYQTTSISWKVSPRCFFFLRGSSFRGRRHKKTSKSLFSGWPIFRGKQWVWAGVNVNVSIYGIYIPILLPWKSTKRRYIYIYIYLIHGWCGEYIECLGFWLTRPIYNHHIRERRLCRQVFAPRIWHVTWSQGKMNRWRHSLAKLPPKGWCYKNRPFFNGINLPFLKLVQKFWTINSYEMWRCFFPIEHADISLPAMLV